MSSADVARRYLQALSGDDPDAVAALVSDDFRNEHLSALGSNSLGRDEYRRRLPGFMTTLAGRRYDVIDVVHEDRDDGSAEVVVWYRLTATAEGVAIDIPGMMWITVADGAITRRVDCWDSQTFLRQTGAAP
jgi:steroid delta-isomerase-like uncharacterized protein